MKLNTTSRLLLPTIMSSTSSKSIRLPSSSSKFLSKPIIFNPSTPFSTKSIQPSSLLPPVSSTFRSYSSSAAPSSETYYKKQPSAWYKSPALIVLACVPLLTGFLGWWQIQRLKWKLGLIEELEDKLRRDPMRLPKNINLKVLPTFAFRLFNLSGRFDTTSPIFIGPRVRDGTLGYQVIMPFYRSEGGLPVMVDRGFVRKDMIEGEGERMKLRNNGEGDWSSSQEILALLPKVSPPNYFTPKNEPSRGLWFHSVPEEMSQYLTSKSSPNSTTNSTTDSLKGLVGMVPSQRGEVSAVLLEEVFNGNAGEAAQRVQDGIPIGRPPTIELRNQHATYAATWLSLSAATTAMFVVVARRGGK